MHSQAEVWGAGSVMEPQAVTPPMRGDIGPEAQVAAVYDAGSSSLQTTWLLISDSSRVSVTDGKTFHFAGCKVVSGTPGCDGHDGLHS